MVTSHGMKKITIKNIFDVINKRPVHGTEKKHTFVHHGGAPFMG